MPSAPLFYQPLVMARVYSTKIGDKTTVADSFQQQQKLTQEAYANPKYKPAMSALVNGFTQLQEQLPGSKSLDNPQFAFDDEGYVANRVMTYARLHADQFDAASPDQAAEMGAKLVQEAAKELESDRTMRAVGDTMEFTPRATSMLKHYWEGNELPPEAVAELGVNAARELQRAVTPLDADATHPQLQWIEDATADVLGHWDGIAAETAAMLGLKGDPAVIGKAVEAMRAGQAERNPYMDSVTRLLGAAGVSGTDDAAGATAFKMLQSTPLEGVPGSIAQALVGANELPADKGEYLASRIVETTGSKGNISGLLAEIELMKQPPPVEPPPGGNTPPPTGGTPPPGPPNPEPPPGGTTPPPVEPPKTEPPATEPPKTEPPATEPPKTEPPATEPPKTEPPATEPPKTEPPKTEPPATEPPKTDAAPADAPSGEQPIVTATGGGRPLTDEQFQQLLASVRAELDREQGPHPVDAVHDHAAE